MATDRPLVAVPVAFDTAMSTPSAACDWFTCTACAAPLVPVLPFTVKPTTAVAFTLGEIVFCAVLVGPCKIHVVQVCACNAYTAELKRFIGSISSSGKVLQAVNVPQAAVAFAPDTTVCDRYSVSQFQLTLAPKAFIDPKFTEK